MSTIVSIILDCWDYIKHFFVKILSFAKNIVSYFKNSSVLNKIKQNKNFMAVTVKDYLDNGNYKIINCLFDKEYEQIVDMEEEAVGIEANEIDQETIASFGDKDMIVIK